MTQKEALDILKMGHNVFLTGSAGSGKTFLLNQYIDYLRKKKIGIGITASTGVAATHMNGVTIHSWSGMGIKDNLTDYDMQKLLKRRHLKKKTLKKQRFWSLTRFQCFIISSLIWLIKFAELSNKNKNPSEEYR